MPKKKKNSALKKKPKNYVFKKKKTAKRSNKWPGAWCCGYRSGSFFEAESDADSQFSDVPLNVKPLGQLFLTKALNGISFTVGKDSSDQPHLHTIPKNKVLLKSKKIFFFLFKFKILSEIFSKLQWVRWFIFSRHQLLLNFVQRRLDEHAQTPLKPAVLALGYTFTISTAFQRSSA